MTNIGCPRPGLERSCGGVGRPRRLRRPAFDPRRPTPCSTGSRLERGSGCSSWPPGPGSLGTAWSQLVGPTGSVVLSDIAPGMVEVARRRNAQLGNVEVAVIDASAIDRPDDSFDVVACRMGLMFTPDPGHRVLRDPPRARSGRAHRRAHVGGHGAQPVDDVCRHGRDDERARGRRTTDRPGRHLLARRSRPSSSDWRRTRGSSTSPSTRSTCPSCRTVSTRTSSESARSRDRWRRPSRPRPPISSQPFRRSAAELAAPYVTDDGVSIPGRALLVTGHA